MNSDHQPRKKNKIRSSILTGFLNTFRSFTIVRRNKELRLYFLIPFILNVLILSFIFYYSYNALIPLVKSFISGDQWYIQFIRFFISPVLFVMLTVGTVLIYSIAGGIITAPFLDLLSSKTERILGYGYNETGFSLKIFLSGMYRALVNSVRLLILIISINFILLILNFIPGGSLVYAFLNFFSALFFYGFQFYDFPLERRRLTFNEKLRLTWKFRWSVFGSGLAFFIISFVPAIGFLGLNLCTAGAAITFCEDIEPVLSADAESI